MSTHLAFAGIARLAEDEGFDPNAVSPGVAGFFLTALVALGVILLGYDLVRRLRRSRYREEIRQSLAAELAEREQQQVQEAAASDGAAGSAEPDARDDGDPAPNADIDPAGDPKS